MTWVATELSLKNLFAPWLEQVACLTEKRVVVASKNNSRSRYFKVLLRFSQICLLANDESISTPDFFSKAEISNSGLNVGRRIFVSERFYAESAREVPRNSCLPEETRSVVVSIGS